MFSCYQCGGCCKNVVFHIKERQIALSHASFEGVSPKIISRFRHALEYKKSDNFNQREHYFLSGPCSFLDEKEGCLIYLSRPFNCRNFMCGRKSETEELEWDGNVCTNQMNRIKAEPDYKEYVRQTLEKNMEYARTIKVI